MEQTVKQRNGTPGTKEKILAPVSLALMVSLPFLQPFHTQPIPSFHTEWLAFLLGLIACICAVPRADGHSTLAVPRITQLPLALIAAVLLQLVLGRFAYTANAAVISFYLIWSAAIACTGATLARQFGEAKLVTVLAWALFAGGIVSALCGFVQYAGLQQTFNGWVSEPMDLSHHGIYGNLAQQNHFATHLALAMASGLYLLMSGHLKLHLLVPALLLMGAALLLSGSRSALLYLPWIALLALLQARANGRLQLLQRLPSRLGIWVVCLFALATAALWLLARLSHIPQLARLFDVSAAFGPRVFLWRHAWVMFLQHPVLGVGFEGFAAELVRQIGDSHQANPWGVDPYAHDLLLHLMAVSGLCGLLAFAIPAGLFLKRQVGSTMTGERFWLWALLGMLALHSLLEQPLFYSDFLGLAAVLLGLADPVLSTYSMGRIARSAVLLGSATAVLVLLKTWHDYDRLEQTVFGERAALVDQASRQAVLLELHGTSLLMPLTELSAPELFAPNPATARQNLAFNERVMHVAPTAEVEFRAAVLLADANQADEAQRQFDRAAYAYPDYTADYAKRFEALGQTDTERYGALAAHVRQFMLAH